MPHAFVSSRFFFGVFVVLPTGRASEGAAFLTELAPLCRGACTCTLTRVSSSPVPSRSGPTSEDLDLDRTCSVVGRVDDEFVEARRILLGKLSDPAFSAARALVFGRDNKDFCALGCATGPVAWCGVAAPVPALSPAMIARRCEQEEENVRARGRVKVVSAPRDCLRPILPNQVVDEDLHSDIANEQEEPLPQHAERHDRKAPAVAGRVVGSSGDRVEDEECGSSREDGHDQRPSLLYRDVCVFHASESSFRDALEQFELKKKITENRRAAWTRLLEEGPYGLGRDSVNLLSVQRVAVHKGNSFHRLAASLRADRVARFTRKRKPWGCGFPFLSWCRSPSSRSEEQHKKWRNWEVTDESRHRTRYPQAM